MNDITVNEGADLIVVAGWLLVYVNTKTHKQKVITCSKLATLGYCIILDALIQNLLDEIA